MILRIILILLSFDCVLVLFPQTNPIGGITLLLGDLLNFVVSNKKLSIMNKFVEITVDGEKCIINASAVQLVKPTDEGTLKNGAKIHTEFSFQELSNILLN